MFGQKIEREVINGIVEEIENRGLCSYITLSSMDDSAWRLTKLTFYKEISRDYMRKPVDVITTVYGRLFLKFRQEISSSDMRDSIEMHCSEMQRIKEEVKG